MKLFLTILAVALSGCASVDKKAAAQAWADYDARVAADNAQRLRQIGR